jgi:hypothetical protein
MDNKRQGRNVFVSTFRVPDEYERSRMEAERRAALAEMLEAQAYQPLNVNQPAPIAPSQGLAKVLKQYMGAYEKRKAREAEEKAKGEELETAAEIQGRLMGVDQLFDRDKTGEMQSIYATPEQQQAQIEADIARQRATGQLEEMTPTAQYQRDPMDALRLASTPAGIAATRGNPTLAAMLQKSMETPAAEEFYAPTETAKGFVQFGKRGGKKETGLQAAPKSTNLQQDYEFAVNQGYEGSFDDFRKSGVARTSVDVRYGAPVQGVDPEGNPIFFQPNPTGGPPVIIEGVKPEGRKLTQEEKTGRLYASRMAQAESVFEGLPVPGLGEKFKEGVPLGVGNLIITPESRQFYQAERNFINATLRRESGAVISDAEFDNARKQYIPQPGDDPVTLENKRQNRELAIQLIGNSENVATPSAQAINFASQGKAASNFLSPADRSRLDELRRKRAGGG